MDTKVMYCPNNIYKILQWTSRVNHWLIDWLVINSIFGHVDSKAGFGVCKNIFNIVKSNLKKMTIQEEVISNQIKL